MMALTEDRRQLIMTLAKAIWAEATRTTEVDGKNISTYCRHILDALGETRDDDRRETEAEQITDGHDA